MIRNWLIVAFRNLIKRPLYSTINILGLAVGLASCVAIILFVQDEVSFDRWIPDAARIVRVHTRFDFPGRAPMRSGSTAGPAMPALEQDFPQAIESGVRLVRIDPVVRHGAELYFEAGAVVDPTFFDVFDLPFASGEKAAALKQPNSVVLAEGLARKYFGDKNPIGQVLTLSYARVTHDFQVSAVIKDLPANSTLKLDLLLPLTPQDFAFPNYQPFDSWDNQFMWTFLKLRPGVTIAQIADELPAFLKRRAGDKQYMSMNLMSLPDLHLKFTTGYSATAANRERIVTAFSVIAGLILAIASINFVNLATAQATQRAREVAMRKVLGAHRSHLVVQFIGESVLVALLALGFALVALALLMPALNGVLQKQMAMVWVGKGSLLPSLLGLIAVVGALGGIYPALYLSRIAPARILKPVTAVKLAGNISARQVLVVLQFVISIALIICTLVVRQQTEHMRTMDAGYEREGLLAVRGLGRPDAKPATESLRNEIARIPGVTSVVLSGEVPGDTNNSETIVARPGSADRPTINVRNVGYDFFSTYHTPVVAGREFSADHPGDDFTGTREERAARGGNVMLNITALGRFGFTTPAAAIGQTLNYDIGLDNRSTPVTIVGVVADMQFRSARDELPPTVFFRNSDNFQSLTVRYAAGRDAEVRSAVETAWRRQVPSIPFKADFLTSVIDAQYQAEQAQGVMFTAFAGLAIVVACLGLFGLAAFTAERRTKEIGLRKVVGARVRDIVGLLVWQFSQPVAVANLLAWPLAYVVMRNWLDGFQFRIDLSPLYFLGAGLAALLIAWVTIVGHAVKAARAKPIIALRYE